MKKKNYIKTGIKLAIGITILLWLWNTVFGDNERNELSNEFKKRLKGE